MHNIFKRAVQSPSASSGTHSPQAISKSLPEAISAQALADSYSSRLFPQALIDESSSSPSSSSQYSSVYSTAADVFRMIASPMTSSPREPARPRSPSPFHVHRQVRNNALEQYRPIATCLFRIQIENYRKFIACNKN